MAQPNHNQDDDDAIARFHYANDPLYDPLYQEEEEQQHQAYLQQQQHAQQQALDYQASQQYTSQFTSQGASHPQAFRPPPNQRGVPAGSSTLPSHPRQVPPFPPSSGGSTTNPQQYTPQLPGIGSFDPSPRPSFSPAAPPAQITPTNRGVFPTNAQPHQPSLPSIPSFYNPPGVSGAPPQAQATTSARRYIPPTYPPPLAAPPVQVPPTGSAGFPTNTHIYSGPPLPPFNQFESGAPPVQFPAARSGGFATNPPYREHYPPGPSIENPPLNPLAPSFAPPNQQSLGGRRGTTPNAPGRPGPSIARPPRNSRPPPPPPSAAFQDSATAHRANLSRATQVKAKQLSTAKASQQKELKSGEKHPHTEPRMCKRTVRTFEGCPCELIDLESCKGDKLVDKDPSALKACEAFKEVTKHKPSNCGGKGDHWACPAMIRFWSEKKVVWGDGSFMWI